MGCCEKGKTHRRQPKRREGMWKDLDLALAEADGAEVEVAQVLSKAELQKAAGCPEGQHKHAPYDYCHPADRKHRGYTDEKPSGGYEAAQGVLQTAAAEAAGMGATEIAGVLQRTVMALAEVRPPERKAFLKELALKYEKAEQRTKASRKPRIRATAAKYRFVKQKLKQAAMRMEPETPGEAGERAGKVDQDIKGMSDSELEEGLKKLKNFLGTKGGELSADAFRMFNDRAATMMEEARRRGVAGYGHAGPKRGPRRG